MRQVLIAAAALTLAGAPAVLAQDHDHGGERPGGGRASNGGHPAAPGGGYRGAPPQARPQGPPGGQGGYRGPQGRAQANFQGPPGGQGGYRGVEPNREGLGGPYHGPSAAYRGEYQGGGNRGGEDYRGGYGRGYGPGNGPGGVRGFQGPGRFSYRGQNFPAFRVGAFRYPPGWGYRRWAVGGFLPGLFLGGSYFIGDWDAYDLGPPPPTDHWVRYGPDALLVNNYTGQIDDVVYGVFYD